MLWFGYKTVTKDGETASYQNLEPTQQNSTSMHMLLDDVDVVLTTSLPGDPLPSLVNIQTNLPPEMQTSQYPGLLFWVVIASE